MDMADAEQWRRAFWFVPRWSATLAYRLTFLFFFFFSQGPRGSRQADECVIWQALRNPGGRVRFGCLD
jgi:hypothetical protein